MLDSEQAVCFNKATIDRRIHTSNTVNDITGLNINDRMTKLKN